MCAQYGWPERQTPERLSDESKELLLASYHGNPKWNSQGQPLLMHPDPLLAGRLLIELYAGDCPKAVANFLCLCTGEKGKGKASGKPLHYKGCVFHRCIKGFVIQSGDIVKGDGSGGDSIYGGKFNDEKGGMRRKHDAIGVVGMANSGKNSNTSQFYITLAPAPQNDGKHIVIGRVIRGIEVLDRMNKEVATDDGRPALAALIADCGVV